MPAVKHLHQQSASNTKPEFIMGHSLQAVSLLVHSPGGQVAAVPLTSRIHEGLVFSNRDARSLLDKLVALLLSIARAWGRQVLLVADAYYASAKVIVPLLDKQHHLLTRAKSNVVAFMPVPKRASRAKGRPRIYGQKVRLKDLACQEREFTRAPSPVYGEHDVYVRYRVVDLMWRPVARIVRFVIVHHPARGTIFLLCTDLSLEPLADPAALRVPVQDRARLSPGRSCPGHLRLSLLDGTDEACASRQRQPVSASNLGHLSTGRTPQAACLPRPPSTRLHRPGFAAAPGPESHRCRLVSLSQLAAHHEPGHATLRVDRRQCAALLDHNIFPGLRISPGTQESGQHLLPPRSAPGHRSDRRVGRIGELSTVQLLENGVKSGVYHSKLTLRARAGMLGQYRRGDIDVLVTCRALDEGFNVPETELGIIAASTATRRQRIQRLGRVVRPARGKAGATIYTLVATGPEIDRLKEEEERLEGVASVRWSRA